MNHPTFVFSGVVIIHGRAKQFADAAGLFLSYLVSMGIARNSFSYEPMPATGSDKGRLWSNYRAALRFFDAKVQTESVERLRPLYKALLEFISAVQIDVRDPTNGPRFLGPGQGCVSRYSLSRWSGG